MPHFRLSRRSTRAERCEELGAATRHPRDDEIEERRAACSKLAQVGNVALVDLT